jgi:acetylornithine deacetylase/succinyl-diaminopimelate desuccinylase family protein
MPEATSEKADVHKLLAWLRQREDEMASLLAELVAVPTENPPGREYSEFLALFESRLRQFGLARERILQGTSQASEGIEDAPSLCASFGHGNRVLYFHGHYDVVPAQSETQFQPSRKDHFVAGRGTADMKGGIVAMLYAMLALRETGTSLNGQIKLILVPDEETGGARGSALLAKKGLLGNNGAGMLIAEPTSGVVWNGNRGAITMRIEVFGKPAHVALQHKGENAFERMFRVVERFEELKREVEQRVTAFPVAGGALQNSILLIGGQSGGGTNFNVVPEKCWFTLDRRINPEENLSAEKARMIGILEKCREEGIPLQWEVFQEGNSSAFPAGEPVGNALAEVIQEVTGRPADFGICPGLLESRFYGALGVPAYAYGPGLLSVAHGPDEYVDLRKVLECAAIYALTARNLLNA